MCIEINHTFLISPLLYISKNSKQKFKYLEELLKWTKKAFEVKWKAFFIISKEISVAKNCPTPKRLPLGLQTIWIYCDTDCRYLV